MAVEAKDSEQAAKPRKAPLNHPLQVRHAAEATGATTLPFTKIAATARSMRATVLDREPRGVARTAGCRPW